MNNGTANVMGLPHGVIWCGGSVFLSETGKKIF